ncbi:MAG: anti-sigma-I factor RsgI family protein [Acholeplasmatales bacterium]
MNIKKRLKIESKILINDDLKRKTLRKLNLEPTRPKRKRIFVVTPLITALAAALLIFVIIFAPRSNEGENILILSINPQVLLKYGSENAITEVEPLNEDAVILLYDLEINLNGKDLEEGISIIETKAKLAGYQNDMKLTHVGKTRLRLNNYEVTHVRKSYYETILREKGYSKKELNVSNEMLVKLAFNTNEDRLSKLKTTLSLQTSKINNLINNCVNENEQKGEAVLQSIKDLLENFTEEGYQELMSTKFKSEPMYADKETIYEQLENLLENYDEYIRYQSIQIRNRFKNEIKNMINVIKENEYNPEVLDGYEVNTNGTEEMPYSDYKSYTREEKVLFDLIDEMTRLLKMKTMSRYTSGRIDILYASYLILKENPNVSDNVLNSLKVREFEILYESKRGNRS